MQLQLNELRMLPGDLEEAIRAVASSVGWQPFANIDLVGDCSAAVLIGVLHAVLPCCDRVYFNGVQIARRGKMRMPIRKRRDGEAPAEAPGTLQQLLAFLTECHAKEIRDSSTQLFYRRIQRETANAWVRAHPGELQRIRSTASQATMGPQEEVSALERAKCNRTNTAKLLQIVAAYVTKLYLGDAM